MSLTGFLFGNVDEEGNLSDTEMDTELRDTLGEGGGYLSQVLGSSLFTDTKSKPSDADNWDTETNGATRRDYESATVKHAKDAIDYSDITELADDAGPKRWDSLPQASTFKFNTLGRTQMDDDYDSEGEADVVDEVHEGAQDHEYSGSEEEAFDDLFESPEHAKPIAATAGVEATQLAIKPEAPVVDVEPKQISPKKSVRIAAPRGIKRIPPGPIRFSDYFGCRIIRHVKRPRRPHISDLDHDMTGMQLAAPVDTRSLLVDKHVTEKRDNFLRAIIAQSMASDEKSDVYVTIDAHTGKVTSQVMEPKRRVDSQAELFRHMPLPVDLDDWENDVIWHDDGEAKQVDSLVLQPKNMFLEDYEKHIIWDTDTPFQPNSQLQINLNDTHMLFEDASSIRESHAREAEQQRLLEGVDRFNLSNDHFYEALQEGKVHRVRQTFGQLIIAHSLPSLRLQPPYFKMRLSRADLRAWHRPFLQAPVDAAVQFSRVRSAKKRKQKYSMENPWAAKDVTLKDTADSVLIEYAEEYPLVLSNVGMGSVFVNYYRKRDMQDRSFPKVELGELFILDINDTSPFLSFGNIESGQVVPALYNNMFRAPLFAQKVRQSDFLVVKHVAKGGTKWYVRGIKYQYVSGQTYPLHEVPAPHSRKVTTTIKHRLQVAAYRLMNRNQYHLLQMAKLSRLFPEYTELQIRQRLKEFCEYQRKGLGAGYWRPKHNMPIPDEENLRKMLTPEMLCLFESMRVCQQQLHDAGKHGEGNDEDTDEADSRLSIEEILATWNLTRNFINATSGKAMLKLHGEGDPTGKGEGFSFVRVSMKDIFLRAGESVEEKLAEIEARPKSAHRYNVAEQQQIYKEEITSIWNKQRESLTQSEPPADSESEAWMDENVIVPEVNDMFGDSATGIGIAAIDPSRMVIGSAMDVSQKLSRSSNNVKATAHANFIQPNRKGLVIRRAVKSPYTGELTWRAEVIRDLAVIQAYLRQRRIIENLAYGSEDLFDDEDEFGMEPQADMTGETRAHLGRLKRAREQRGAQARAHEKTHMTTFSLPQPSKPKKVVVRQCGNCGQLGHMKTNKKCPRYFEFNPV
ncbi:hypothetical protein IWW56_001541 [Coemansia sp. RSA 2131]|nr:hypothetical protein IWW56_001541 [Coemansia sp. RSA 2131]